MQEINICKKDFFGSRQPSYVDFLHSVNLERISNKEAGKVVKVIMMLSVPVMWGFYIAFFVTGGAIGMGIGAFPFIAIATAVIVVTCFGLWGKVMRFAEKKEMTNFQSENERAHAQQSLNQFGQIEAMQEARANRLDDRIQIVRAKISDKPRSRVIWTPLVWGFIMFVIGAGMLTLVSIMEYRTWNVFSAILQDPILNVTWVFMFLGLALVVNVFMEIAITKRLYKRYKRMQNTTKG